MKESTQRHEEEDERKKERKKEEEDSDGQCVSRQMGEHGREQWEKDLETEAAGVVAHDGGTMGRNEDDTHTLLPDPLTPAASSSSKTTQDTPHSILRVEPVRYLLLSHFFSSFGDRMWAFAAPIIFVDVFPDTLLPAALYAFTSYLACFLFGPYMGFLIDRTRRLRVVQVALITQNTCVVAASLLLLSLLPFSAGQPPFHDVLFTCLFALLNLVGSIGSVASMAGDVSVGRDWTVVVAQETCTALSEINATVRRIDLSCAVLSPLAASVVLTTTGNRAGIFLVTAWKCVVVGCLGYLGSADTLVSCLGSVATWFPEYYMLRRVHTLVPPLAQKTESGTVQHKGHLRAMVDGWAEFKQQSVAWASGSYALLYLTVLSPGVLMTAFLKSQGIGAVPLAIFLGVASLAGLAATLLSPPLIRRRGLLPAARIFLTFQWAWLVPTLLLFFALGSQGAWVWYVMLSTLVLSRCGLWGFDLCEREIMQKSIPEAKRGVVNSVESSLTQVFSLLAFLMGVIVHNPALFRWLAVYSFSAVSISFLIFLAWARSHLARALFPTTDRKVEEAELSTAPFARQPEPEPEPEQESKPEPEQEQQEDEKEQV